MGSHGNGLLLGVRAGKAPKKLGDEGWNKLGSQYAAATRGEPPETSGSPRVRLLGYYVALGHETEKKGVPTLTEPLRLSVLAGDIAGWEEGPLRRRGFEASRAWVAFVRWAEMKGHRFALGAELWIVETEVG